MRAPLQGTDEWVAWRNGGIGASELPVIVNESPYQSEYELALLKRGLTDPKVMTTAMSWGHRVQRMAVDVYAEMTGRRVRNVNTSTTSKRYPHVYASLDARCVGERRGVEVKLTSRWDDPPRHVLIQVQGQMGVCDLDVVDIIRVGMYGEPAIFPIERDDALIADLLPLGEEWYVRYVLTDELPNVDGSRAAGRYLDRMEGPPEMVATSEQQMVAARLRHVRAAMKLADREHDELVNRLKESMAGAESLLGDGFRVAWKSTKPRTTTEWRAVASELAPEGGEAWQAALDRHTTTGEGSRPFRLTFDKEGDAQ